MSAKPLLHSVPDEPVKEPAPDMSYEHQERRRIAERDWAAVHVASDRRAGLSFLDRVRRTWLR